MQEKSGKLFRIGNNASLRVRLSTDKDNPTGRLRHAAIVVSIFTAENVHFP
jgi:hypothetical protein